MTFCPVPSLLQKTIFSCSTFLSWSRACLGKMIDVWYIKWRKKQTRCPHPADETLERSAFISSDVELISSSRAGRHFNAAVLRAAAVEALLAGIMSRQVSSFCQSQPTSVTCRVNYIDIYIHDARVQLSVLCLSRAACLGLGKSCFLIQVAIKY
eukprot:COSAG06_NODE_11573_length_1490_cov_1.064702_2_plen_154_part_00